MRKKIILTGLLGIDEKQNYGKFSFSGIRGSRKLTVELLGIKGEKAWRMEYFRKRIKNTTIIYGMTIYFGYEKAKVMQAFRYHFISRREIKLC